MLHLASTGLHLWQWLTEPHTSIREPEQRRRARILSSVLIVAILLVILELGKVLLQTSLTYQPVRGWGIYLVLAALAAMVFAYALSRAQHYTLASTLAVGMAFAVTFASVIIAPEESFHLAFVIFGGLMASLFLSLRSTILIFMATLGGIVLLAIFVPQLPPTDIVNTLLLLVVSGILIVAASAMRQRDLDQIKQQARELVAELAARKQMEKVLHESEERFRRLAEAPFEGIAIHEGGKIVDANYTVAALFGYELSEAIGMSPLDFVAPESRETVSAAIASRREESYEAVGLKKNGETFPIEIRARHIPYQGRTVRVVAVRDISERKRLEQELQTQHAFMTQVIDNMGQGLTVTDAEGRFEFVNPAYARMIGCAPEDLVGKTPWDVTAPDDHAVLDRESARRQAGENSMYETRLLHRAGYPVPVLITSVPRWREGGRKGAIAAITDLTEHKQMEEAEREQRAFTDALRDAATALNSTLNFDEVLERILVNVNRVIPHDAASIMLVDAATGIARIVRCRGYAGRGLESALLARRFLTQEIPGFRAMLETKQALVIPDTQTNPDWHVWSETQWIRSYIGAPIHIKGQVIGFLNLDSATPNFFSTAHAAPLQVFADHAAIALENARLLAETDRRASEFAALYETTRDLATLQPDLRALLQIIMDRAMTLLAAPSGGIYLYDVARGDLELAVSVANPAPCGTRLKLGEGMAGRVAQTREPLRIDNYSIWEHRSSQYTQVPFAAVLEVPMVYAGELIGVLTVNEMLPSTRTFTEADVQLLSLFAGQAASVVHSARLFDQAQRRLRETLLLNRVIAATASALDPTAVLKIICEELARAFDLPRVGFAQLAADRAYLTIVAEYCAGELASSVGEIIPLADNAATQYVIEQRVPLVIANAQTDERQVAVHALQKQYDIASLFIVPLIIRDEVIGTLGLSSAEPRDFGADEIALAQSATRAASQALENARLFESAQNELAERKQMESALRESERRFKGLFEDAPISLWEEDFSLIANYIEGLRQTGITDWRAFFESHPEVVAECATMVKVVDVNKETLRLFKAKSKDDFLMGLDKVFCEESFPVFGEELIAFAEGKNHFAGETTNQTLAGDRIQVAVSWALAPGTDQIAARLFVSLNDITERKRAEHALYQANEKLKDYVIELERYNQENILISEMNDLLQVSLTVDEAYNIIAQYVAKLLPEKSGALFVFDSSRNFLDAVATWGDALMGERLFAPADCWGLRRGRAYHIENPRIGVICRHLEQSDKAGANGNALRLAGGYVCAPMIAQGEALGVLHLQSHSAQDQLSEWQQRLLARAAERVALALANLQLRETLRAQSIRDPLTGLFNRRYMEESIERELRRAHRKHSSVGIIMLDIDRFKRFNDTFGHDAGDTMLRELGAFLRSHIRGEDIACRYGGEEFILILPETAREAARQRAEHIRKEVKHLTVEYHRQPLGAITFSLGVAIFPDDGATAEMVMRAVDAALYRAKQAGRDRVQVADGNQ